MAVKTVNHLVLFIKLFFLPSKMFRHKEGGGGNSIHKTQVRHFAEKKLSYIGFN